MSDNGGLSINPYRGGPSNTQNLPLKSGKGSVYEGGIREPMIVKWPGHIEPATKCDKPVIIEDFFPTILEMAQIDTADIIQNVDGQSFMNNLINSEQYYEAHPLIWYVPHTTNRTYYKAAGPGMNYHSAIRFGEWKLIYNIRTHEKALYNLKDDIGESRDLKEEFPQKVEELSQILSSKLREWKAVELWYKNTNEKVPLPDGN